LKIKASKFIVFLLAAFVIANILIFVIVDVIAQTLFESMLLNLVAICFSAIAFFFIIARRLIPSEPSRLWAKFACIVLALIFFYTALSLTMGESLLSIMGILPSSPPPDFPLSAYELNRLALLSIGFSYTTNGLIYLTIAYLLQKFVVRLVYHAYRLMTRCPNFFFQANREEKKLSVVTFALWLILLPFPLQQTLSIGASEALLSTAFILPTALVVFALYGLGASALVGTTEDKVFRLSDMLYQSLFYLIVGEWISFIVYGFFANADFVQALSTMVMLFARSLLLFGPCAIITAYFYTRFLESRAKAKIVEYLSEKERLAEKVLTITADKKIARSV